MAQPGGAARRVGSAGSATRAALLRTAEKLMLDQGYAAVTYRAVAAEAGVAAGLVQYYFPKLDDLFTALLRDGTDRIVERIAAAAKTERPLRAIWAYANDPVGTRMLMEFMSLANHRKGISEEIGRGGERVREAQMAVLAERWDTYRLGDEELTPASLLFVLSSLPRMAFLEKSVGTSLGHADTFRLVERFLNRVEPKPPRRRATSPKAADA